MNTTALIIISVAAAVIVVLLIMKNLKDKKELEEKLNNDYPKRKAGDEDIGVEDKI
jgi:low affinity Fe/Cu permease